MPRIDNGRPRINLAYLAKIKGKCQFCQSENMDRETYTCKDCGTTNPGGFTANRRAFVKTEKNQGVNPNAVPSKDNS